MIGIVSFGAYIPRLRLDRMAICGQLGWMAPAIMAVAQGERSFCNWDEDALTMAVAAARDCLSGVPRGSIDEVFLCSTTLPFADRLNAGILKGTLDLRDDVQAVDLTGSLRCGTTGLISALEAVRSGDRRQALVAASDMRHTRAASFYEMWFGDGAASVLVGTEDVKAEFLGSFSVTHDFIDHYRGADSKFDYTWEERWVREEGYSKIIPQAVGGLLKKTGISIKDVSALVFPCVFKAEYRSIAKILGANPSIVQDNLHEVCGETGSAHPLVMLSLALENAKPGEVIVVAGFGQGADALCFKATENITAPRQGLGASGYLARRKSIDQYSKFLKFRDLIQTESGIRAEAPIQTAMTVLWRNRRMLGGLVGGLCPVCKTPQFPMADVCVNPACKVSGKQDDYQFADRLATVKTFTGDWLAISPEPPSVYGLIQFDGGGRFMADFTDCEPDDITVGTRVTMAFRKRYTDTTRGFTGYFWKAQPAVGK